MIQEISFNSLNNPVWPLMEGWEEAMELEERWFSPSCRSCNSNLVELAARKQVLMTFYVLWIVSQSCDFEYTCLQSWPLSDKVLIGKRALQEYSNKRRGWYLCNGQNAFSQLTAMFSPHHVFFLPSRYLEALVIVFPSSTLEVDKFGLTVRKNIKIIINVIHSPR